MSRLRLHDVSVRYGRQRVVNGLSLDIGSGSWLGIIGPNGVGKSSLLKAVAGIVGYSGSVTVDGAPLDSMERRQRARTIAYVPQAPMLPDDMSCFDYVLLGRTAHIGYFGTDSAQDRGVAEAALQRLDVADFGDRLLGTLSGGERQRVVLARAIATEASVLLLDEPTTALDIGHQLLALELVDDLRRTEGLTVVAALHDLTLAAMFCERLALIERGGVVAVGAPVAVLRSDLIAAVYGADVVVTVDGDRVTVSPRRRSALGTSSVS